MSRDEGAEQGGTSLLAKVLTWVCVTLGAALLWQWFGPSHRTRIAPETEIPEAGRPAEALPSRPSEEPPRAMATDDGRAGSARETRQAGGSRAAAPVEESQGARGADPRHTGTADWPAAGVGAQPHDVAAHGAPEPDLSTSPDQRSGSPVQGPTRAAPGTAGVATERAGAPSTGQETAPLTVSRVGTAPVPAAPATPPGDTKDTGDESPDEPESDADEPAGSDPSSDRTPPVLASLRFDPPVVEGGSATTLTIEARDDLSGVKSVRGEVRSPNGSAVIPFGSTFADGAGVSTCVITLPREAESGTWYVTWISLTDGAANSALIQAAAAAAAPPGGTFSVHSSQSDSTPPEVLQVSFRKPALSGGEKNVIEVEARDDSSGVASMMGACQSPSKAALIWFTGALNPASGIWEGEVALPQNADCGDWTVQQLAVKDKAGNTNLLRAGSPLLARAGFQVSVQSDCDFTPPSLDSFDLSPSMVPSDIASEIVVTATVSDVGSGVALMSGWFEGPVPQGGQAPKSYFTCAPDPKVPSGPWTGKVKVPQFAAKGTWKVGTIRLEDKARNYRVFTASDPVTSGRVFEVR